MERRQFLKATFGGLIALGARASGQVASRQVRSRVVIARHKLFYSLPDEKPYWTLDANQLYWALFQMVNVALARLFGTGDAPTAWRRLIKPNEIVGIKVNCIAGATLSTSPMLVNAIIASLCSSGIRQEQIIVWDRMSEELKRAGYVIRTSPPGVLCYGTDVVGYRKQLSSFGEVTTFVSNIIAQQCDAIINAPVLKTHQIAGITAALKNHFGSINNPNRYHPNRCDPYVADANCLPEIRHTHRLVICDALRPLCHGGPEDNPKFRWNYGGIIVGVDPVAVDACGLQIIRERRKAIRLGEIYPEPTYILTAADYKHSLGTFDERQIDVVEVDLSE
ncbi:MAG: DUF362 domain-containing protein [Armatimonadota bacterium]|nr:DUF362 domain-containing protein [Armatimonadota bacterium]MCX7776576.1 DUF362 domain-containing protein [Armatimonadota bacterium]MDW8026090.1 DUF362 domain-containing protein [Armatimonadota bacterium]